MDGYIQVSIEITLKAILALLYIVGFYVTRSTHAFFVTKGVEKPQIRFQTRKAKGIQS